METNKQAEPTEDVFEQLKMKLREIAAKGNAILDPEAMSPEEVAATIRCAGMMEEIVEALMKGMRSDTEKHPPDLFTKAFLWGTLAPILVFLYNPGSAYGLWISIYQSFTNFNKHMSDVIQEVAAEGETETKH